MEKNKEENQDEEVQELYLEQVKGTNFNVIKKPESGNWAIVLGNQVMLEQEFNSKKEAIDTVLKRDWNLIFNTVFYLIEATEKIKKKTKKPKKNV